MTKEQLLAIDPTLTDEQVTQIISGFEAEQAASPPAGSVPYERFKAVNDAKKTLEGQITSMKAMLKDLTGEGEDFEKAKAALEKKVSEGETKLNDFKKSTLLEKLLTQSGAINFKTVLPLLDEADLAYDAEKGAFTALEESLKKIKEDNPYLFQQSEKKPDNTPPQSFFGIPNPAPPQTTPKAGKSMTYAERVALKQSNPKEYDRLFKGV